MLFLSDYSKQFNDENVRKKTFHPCTKRKNNKQRESPYQENSFNYNGFKRRIEKRQINSIIFVLLNMYYTRHIHKINNNNNPNNSLIFFCFDWSAIWI